MSASEERLLAATVGKVEPLMGTVEPLMGTIVLAPYDPEWPSRYATLERQIREALESKALSIEHVGSTSVPGLPAKPIIDVVLAVESSANEDTYVPPLERLGYVLRIREPDWFEHRMFKSPTIEANIHVFSLGCPEIGRMLAFRDWLRSHDNDRNLYDRTKQDLAGRTWKHVQDYADAKSDVVRTILDRALGTNDQMG
jgi:GrpB-like predicted nucleotidyltransferase (UPF0157 family)